MTELSPAAGRGRNNNRLFLQSCAVILMLSSLACPANEAEWSGKGEFGLVLAHGNSDTETINLGLAFQRHSEKWRNDLRLTALRSSESGELNAERYTLAYKSGHNLDERSYLIGVLRSDQDEFTSNDFQAINSRFALKLSGAVRHNTDVDPGIDETDTLTTANLVYKFGEP